MPMNKQIAESVLRAQNWCPVHRKPMEYHTGFFVGYHCRDCQIEEVWHEAHSMKEALEVLGAGQS